MDRYTTILLLFLCLVINVRSGITDVKDVTPFQTANYDYPSGGKCQRTLFVLVNITDDLDINFGSNAAFNQQLVSTFDRIQVLKFTISIQPSSSNISENLNLYDDKSRHYSYLNFFTNLVCSDSAPFLNSVGNLEIYPQKNPKGFYSTVRTFSDYQYYMGIQTPSVNLQIVDIKRTVFTFTLNIFQLFSDYNINIQDTLGHSGQIQLKTFLTSAFNLATLVTQQSYPTSCVDVNYYHSYFRFSTSVGPSTPTFLGVTGGAANAVLVLPILGTNTNATYLMIRPNSQSSTGSYTYDLSSVVANLQLVTLDSTTCNFKLQSVDITGTLPVFDTKTPSFGVRMTYKHTQDPILIRKDTVIGSQQSTATTYSAYPFGISSANATHVTYDAVFPSLTNLNQVFSIRFAPPFNPQFVGSVSMGTNVQNVAPLLDSIQITESPDEVIFLIGASMPLSSTTGTVSHISIASISGYIDITQSDLVEGTSFNGRYLKSVSKRLLIRWNRELEFTVYNNHMNASTHRTDMVYNKYGHIVPANPCFIPFLPDTITVFQFQSNNVNVQDGPVQNTLYINVSTSKPQTALFSFTPSFYLHYSQFDNQADLLDDTTYYSVWDTSLQVHRIEFIIPEKRFTSTISYKIYPFNVDNTVIFGLRGPTTELRVTSSNADMLPPIVKSIQSYSEVPDPLSPGVVKLGFKINILDEILGFKKGIVVIKSQYDLQGYNFSITPADAVSGDMYDGYYVLKFPVTANDITQQFYLAYMQLEDNSGNKAIYPSYNDVSPFMLFDHGALHKLSITQYTPSTDIDAPHITSLDLSPTTNSVTITFTVQDDVAISQRHLPSVYLTSWNMEIIGNASTIIGTQGKAISYQCTISLPPKFGAPLPVFVSVYNLVDISLNLRGYSSVELEKINLPSQLDFTATPTIVWVSTFDGIAPIVIKGLNFGLSPANIVSIKVIQSTGSSYSINRFIAHSQNTIVTDEIDSYDGKTLSIQVIVDGIGSNVFSIPIESSTGSSNENPVYCTSDAQCGGAAHGVCNGGSCVCIKPYYGIDCSSTVVDNTTQTVDPDHPSVAIGYSSLSSLVSIYSLKELDQADNLLSETVFDQWNYTQNGSMYYYMTRVKQTEIRVVLEQFDKETTVAFAGTSLVMQPSSVKYTIDMGPYPFSSQLNSLQLVIKAAVGSQDTDTCLANDQGTDRASDSDYLRVQINNISLYGRFIKRCVVDSRIKAITNTVYPPAASHSNTTVLVGINIPPYKRFVRLDPDFSVLIDSVPAASRSGSICASPSAGLSAAQIAGIVVGGVVFLILLVGLIVFIIVKKFDDKTIGIKLRRIVAK
ncbi:hypothetical protein CYY_002442 [Polysphondylium violaceum]|uniref:EGF-like domain-containing protein n=1 Tax=Polysphondylium violaceum TaxID=133409 RepID=A0A8J4Q052_9MYCE|nr:hypothetical protein CYY_002442 [Polysphondylium violaceum]